MLTRPACRSVAFAETFKDPSVVAAYRHRPRIRWTCSPIKEADLAGA